MIDPDKLYALDEASPYVGMERSSIYRAIREGKLRAIKTGRTTKLLGSDIIAFRDALPLLTMAPAHRPRNRAEKRSTP